jgi:hypothetical protein
MAQASYSAVPKEAVIAFAKELEQGRWAEIDTAQYQSASDHLSIPVLPLLKIRLLRKINEFSQVVGSANSPLQAADDRWDAAQRKLEARITLAEQDDNETIAQAGVRLRNCLLLGSGLAQTKLSYPEEVAFGHKQIGLVRAEKVAGATYASPKEDAALLGLAGIIAEIEQRTLALEATLPKEGQELSQFDQLKEIYNDCTSLLRSVHHELDLQKSATANGETRQRISELKAPFMNLLNQYH